MPSARPASGDLPGFFCSRHAQRVPPASTSPSPSPMLSSHNLSVGGCQPLLCSSNNPTGDLPPGNTSPVPWLGICALPTLQSHVLSQVASRICWVWVSCVLVPESSTLERDVRRVPVFGPDPPRHPIRLARQQLQHGNRANVCCTAARACPGRAGACPVPADPALCCSL